jgi:CHASE1-domain containing sensor protein
MPLSRPIRLLLEILLIVGLTEAAVMWIMPVLAPGLGPLQESLLDVGLLLLLAAPTVYWRSMVFSFPARATGPRAATKTADQFSFRQAVALTALVHALGLLATAAGVYFLYHDLKTEAATAFTHESERLEREIGRRFGLISYGLSGLRANLAAAAAAQTPVPLPRPAFTAHVAARNMRAEFAGVRGFGFIERLARSDIAAYEQRVQADGAAQYRVRTSGNAPDVFAIRNIEPLADNRAALGYDIGQEPIRREAVERAIASGETSLSGKITLVQDAQRTPGFLLFLPVYREGQAPYLSDLRPATLVGLLYAPVVAQELLHTTRTVTLSHLNFALYDGNDSSDASQIYSDQPGHHERRHEAPAHSKVCASAGSS